LIDGGFIAYAKIRPAELMPLVHPAGVVTTTERDDGRDPVFVAVLDYLLESQRRVTPLYQLEQTGGFALQGPPSEEGRKFIDTQLVRGGEMLASLWVTAWRQAGPDMFLKANLLKRKSTDDGGAAGK